MREGRLEEGGEEGFLAGFGGGGGGGFGGPVGCWRGGGGGGGFGAGVGWVGCCGEVVVVLGRGGRGEVGVEIPRKKQKLVRVARRAGAPGPEEGQAVGGAGGGDARDEGGGGGAEANGDGVLFGVGFTGRGGLVGWRGRRGRGEGGTGDLCAGIEEKGLPVQFERVVGVEGLVPRDGDVEARLADVAPGADGVAVDVDGEFGHGGGRLWGLGGCVGLGEVSGGLVVDIKSVSWGASSC